MKNYDISEPFHHEAGEPIWYVDDIDLLKGGTAEIVARFIERYRRPGYTLAIYDLATAETIEIICTTDEMPKIAEHIYKTEQAFPLTFISLNTMLRAYTIGMTLSRGTIIAGRYEAKDGKLVRCK